MTEIAYQYDTQGLYVGPIECQLNPVATAREGKKVYLVPGNCAPDAPGEIPEGKVARRVQGAWVNEDDHHGKTIYKGIDSAAYEGFGSVLPEGWALTPSEEYLAAEKAFNEETEGARAKLEGVEYLEGGVTYKLSATAEDMWSLASIKDDVKGGFSTNFKFQNGTVLRLTPDNWQAVRAVWLPFRASFFE